MLNFDEVTVASVEDQIITEEMQQERLNNYDKKIEQIMTIILNDKERFVFSKRTSSNDSFWEIATEMGISKDSVVWIMKKAEKKLEAFRKFLSML